LAEQAFISRLQEFKMSLDDMQLTNEDRRWIDERFLELVKENNYTEAKKFYDKLNNEAQRYIRTHDKHAWNLLITEGHYENHKGKHI